MTSSAKPLRVEAPLNTEIPKLSKDDKDSINSHISNIEDKSLVRRPCGCVRTSDKLKNILKTFPQAPPPTGSCRNRIPVNYLQTDQHSNKCKTLFYELVSLLQLSVTATALVIYYIIFCYMQLIYYVLRSIVYFHHADLPMKITITLVTVTGVFIGLNMISRLENLVGVHFRKM